MTAAEQIGVPLAYIATNSSKQCTVLVGQMDVCFEGSVRYFSHIKQENIFHVTNR